MQFEIQFFFVFISVFLFGIAKKNNNNVTVFFVYAIHLLQFSVSVRDWITKKIVSVLFYFFSFMYYISYGFSFCSVLQKIFLQFSQ